MAQINDQLVTFDDIIRWHDFMSGSRDFCDIVTLVLKIPLR